MVKESKETTLWADVKPEMMSDEDREEDFYIRHPPSYRSKALQKFIDKLETRLNQEKELTPSWSVGQVLLLISISKYYQHLRSGQ